MFCFVIRYTIHGGKDLEEIELTHLDGHKGSKPVRIGNGAADHLQLVSAMFFLHELTSIYPFQDIYGELYAGGSIIFIIPTFLKQ